VQPLADGTYRLDVGTNGMAQSIITDYVILALPLTALSIIGWRSANLQRAIARHVG